VSGRGISWCGRRRVGGYIGWCCRRRVGGSIRWTGRWVRGGRRCCALTISDLRRCLALVFVLLADRQILADPVSTERRWCQLEMTRKVTLCKRGTDTVGHACWGHGCILRVGACCQRCALRVGRSCIWVENISSSGARRLRGAASISMRTRWSAFVLIRLTNRQGGANTIRRECQTCGDVLLGAA